MPDAPWSAPAHDPLADLSAMIERARAQGHTPAQRFTVSQRAYDALAARDDVDAAELDRLVVVLGG
ncbi:hypothetical protein SEA_LIGMA_70 [Gordonia phage Ligma]|nr:hypothetical protein SEA_LIGMA_70 [Gordonia phage Ligma]